MASMNPFDLLVDDDTDDPAVFIAAQQVKAAAAAAKKSPGPVTDTSKAAKLPTKPLPPSQAVREARNEGGRGGVGRGGRGYGRGRGPAGADRDFGNNDGILSNANGFTEGFNKESSERHGGYGGGPRGGPRGGRRGGFNNGEADEGERPRRVYDRHSGTGRRGDVKRDGAGRGNWGTTNDEITQEVEEPVAESEAIVVEKQAGEENVDVEKENPEKEPEEKEPEVKEPEDKQMTLEEYEKVLEEKRKALLSLKGEERKVGLDKDFESMQLVSKKKNEEEFFIKLGSDKDKRKEAAEKEEKAKKALSINEFLRPAEGEGYYRSGGRGRGRGRGGRGGFGGGNALNNVSAPAIEDTKQFPILGGK